MPDELAVPVRDRNALRASQPAAAPPPFRVEFLASLAEPTHRSPGAAHGAERPEDGDFVSYERGLALQLTAAERVRSGEDRGTVLLLEHTPVYTAGRRALPEEYPVDGTPVVEVDRGGKVTWHGPGQLVAYPVVRLRNRLGVVDFIRALEQVVIEVAAELGLHGFRIPGRAGVWAHSGGGGAPPALDPTGSDATDIEPTGAEKFAQVGIHVSDGIVTHGLAINCSNELAPFARFVPCGITDAGVTTLSRLGGRTVTPREVAPILQKRLLAALTEVAE